MEDLLRVTGMVIGAIPIGDYDKRLTILTREKGKIQVFVRGAKRPKSMFVAAANPFVYGEFELHAGKNYNLAKANVINYFEGLQSDLDAIYYGSYFLEVANYFALENEPSEELLKLVYVSVLALTKQEFDKRLIRRIFEWKCLVLGGEYPDLYSCKLCRRTDRLAYFSTSREGVTCEVCMQPLGSIPILPTTLYTLQFITATPVTKLFCFQVTDEVLDNLEKIVDDYWYVKVDRDFKSLAFLEF